VEAISESCRVFTHFLRTPSLRCHTLLLFGFPLFAWYCVFFSVAAAAQHHIGSCAEWVVLVAEQPHGESVAGVPREQDRAIVPPPPAAASRPAPSPAAVPAPHAARPPAPASHPPLPSPPAPPAARVLGHGQAHRPGGQQGQGRGLLRRCLFMKCKGTGLSTSLARIAHGACLPRLCSYKHTCPRL